MKANMVLDPRLVLLDLDGTLVDSVPDLAVALDDMQRALGLPERGEANARKWIGNGIERLIKRALTNSLDAEPDADLYQRAAPLFESAYREVNGRHSTLYPGVLEGLLWLSKQNLKLGCITNKTTQFTLPLLKQLGIAGYFELVLSGDSLPERKPHPLPLLHAAQYFHIEPAESLMVGDSITDVKAARAAGFRIICMSYGYNHGLDIRDAQPDVVIDRLDELSGLL